MRSQVLSGAHLDIHQPRTGRRGIDNCESFMRFLPTVAVYAVVHVAVGLPIGPSLLWMIPIIAMITVFGAGAAMFTATSQVYFRDLTNFLPYFTRIWLYTSPILFYAEDVRPSAEIEEGSWYVVPSTAHDVFDEEPGRLWHTVLKRQPGELAWVSTRPVDPTHN